MVTLSSYITPNIFLTGKTGSGKSSLINAIFGSRLSYKGYKRTATVGIGEPVTKGIVRYNLYPNYPLSIFDTPGIGTSLTKNLTIRQQIDGLIDHFQKQGYNENIDVIWYCINTRSLRIEDNEIKWINDLGNANVPLILVLTQFFDTRTDMCFLEYVKSLNLPIFEVVPILATTYEFRNNVSIPSKGIADLLTCTSHALKDRKLFNSLMRNIEGKTRSYSVRKAEGKTRHQPMRRKA